MGELSLAGAGGWGLGAGVLFQTPYGQRTLSGGVLWHWLESVTPEEIWAQAFSVAVRSASSRVLADAVRQAWFPRNVMQTWQRMRPVFRVE